MRDHPVALGFTIWAAFALYTYVYGPWWRFRRRKRLCWERAYIMSLERLSEEVYHWRRAAFAITRLICSLGWPWLFVRTMLGRFEKIYRFVRFKARASHAQQ
jgi:hypothetical protein